MSKEQYLNIRFNSGTLVLIDTMNGVIDEYIEQGFKLTVRQLYYQLVARGIIENTEKSYKRTTNIANDARMAGLMDWDAIEDRTREFLRKQRWDSPREILGAAANSYHIDMWHDQPRRVFCIIEKEALVGVLERTCRNFDVPILAARGYPSGTVLRDFALSDIVPALDDGQGVTILHLGDHDPSGIDMSRDLCERLQLFSYTNDVSLERIALNMEQIEERKPPPNPAKTTDSRFESYVREYGHESWELDALPPQYLADLVQEHIWRYVDDDKWTATAAALEAIRKKMRKIAEEFKP